MLHCGAGGGARSGFGPDDATLNRRGSETMSGSEQTRTFDAQGNSIVSLPTDITVRPFGGVSWALHLDASQRFVNILGENGWEQVMMVGEGYEARYLIPVANSARMGPTDPLVTAVMFLDYTSPPSAALFDVWVAIQRQFAQDVRVVFKFRPGDNDERAMVAAVARQRRIDSAGSRDLSRFHRICLLAPTTSRSVTSLTPRRALSCRRSRFYAYCAIARIRILSALTARRRTLYSCVRSQRCLSTEGGTSG